MFLLLACAAAPGPVSEACDPRALESGEVRVRYLTCSDEAVDGGETRPGDWVLENAVARFGVRGSYAPLTELEGAGGTLIDAAAVGGADVLSEFLPDGERGEVVPVQGDGWAELQLPGYVWRLEADDPALQLVGADAGTLRPLVDTQLAGAVLRAGSDVLALDGTVVGGVGAPRVEGVTRLSVDAGAVFPDPVAGAADADTVAVWSDGVLVDRLPVADGVFDGWAPAGATLLGERAGCVYETLVPLACGTLRLELRDDADQPLAGVLTDGVDRWVVSEGVAEVPLGPEPRTLRVWAGPTHGLGTVAFPGGEARAQVLLRREVQPADWVLADLAVPVAPDDDTREAPRDAMHARLGEGVEFSALVVDDEVPVGTRYARDHVHAVNASRAAGLLWSWPWEPNSRRAAHGAVPWAGLGALDLLTVSRGGSSANRTLVVTPEWVALARAEAPPTLWTEHPHALWLDSLADLPVLTALLDDWEPVAPVGPRTWVQVVGALNSTAVDAGIRAGRTVAGNGPLVELSRWRLFDRSREQVEVRVQAPRWMGITAATLHAADGWTDTQPLVDGVATWTLDADAPWYLASVEGVANAGGEAGAAWIGETAWAVSGVGW